MRPGPRRRRWVLPVVALLLGGCRAEPAAAGGDYEARYTARILPDQGTAEVSLEIVQAKGQVRSLRMRGEAQRYFDFQGPGVRTQPDGGVEWTVPPGGGTLRYAARIDHVRDRSEYDAHVTSSWALLRGEDLFPPVAAVSEVGSHSKATLRLILPPRWRAAVPFTRLEDGRLVIEQSHRRLDLPKGWLLLGDLSTLTADVSGMKVTVASPKDHRVRGLDLLALLRWTLPTMRDLLGGLPDRLLIVGAGDPMWRGGLSGPGSLYVHADRPLIQSDGSSPVLHELVHVVTHAQAGPDADWIVEGLAELYSLELLRRSGTVDEDRHRRTVERLRERGADVKSVVGQESRSKVTARAVTILYELDAQIRKATDGSRSLDDVLRRLAVVRDEVTEARLREIVAEVAGKKLDRFFQTRVPRG